MLGSKTSQTLDAEISPQIGGDVGELIVSSNLSSVIDLSGLNREGQEIFVRDL